MRTRPLGALLPRPSTKAYIGQRCCATHKTSSSAARDASGLAVTQKHQWFHYNP